MSKKSVRVENLASAKIRVKSGVNRCPILSRFERREIRLPSNFRRAADVVAFGSAGPAFAAIFLSRRVGEKVPKRPPLRFLFFATLWHFAWLIYIAYDNLRGVHAPDSLPYYSALGLLAMIPAWILSGAFTRDSGVRELLRTFTRSPNWCWQAFAFFFWPFILLIPAGIVHLLHGSLVTPHHDGSLWMFALYGVISFLSNFLFTAVPEEPGWRGYLLPRLQHVSRRWSRLFSMWFPWALWHAPLDFHRLFRFTLVQYVLIRVVFLIPISLIRPGSTIAPAGTFLPWQSSTPP